MNKYKVIYRKDGVKYSTFVTGINEEAVETYFIMKRHVGRSDILAIQKQ
jgi:hypothetical protein